MRTGLGTSAITTLLVAATCCAPAPQSEAERTVSDTARGVRYVTPPRWRSTDGEVRSPSGTLLTLRVYDLVEADKKFVAELPDSLLPQLVDWSKYYFIVDGDPVRSATTVAGLPATEFDFPIRVRPSDPPSKVLYWVVTRKTRLFVIRGAFPASALAEEEPVLRNVVAGWAFLD